mgnify:CR=1 FL=1
MSGTASAYQFPKITDEGLTQLRERIGQKIEHTVEPWCHEATRDNIRHYAQIVRDRSILRQLAGTAGEIADSAYNPLGRSAKEILVRGSSPIC